MKNRHLFIYISIGLILSALLSISSNIIAGYVTPNFEHKKIIPWIVFALSLVFLTLITFLHEKRKKGDSKSGDKTSNINVGNNTSVKNITQITADKVTINEGDNSKKPSLVIKDMGVEEFDWKNEKYVSFIISNVGGGIALVKNIEIEILETKSYDDFGVKHVGAKLIPNNFKIQLEPSKKIYIINKSPFSYKKDDHDLFRIELSSEGGLSYTFRFNIHWENIKNGESKIDYSKLYTINFSIKDDNLMMRKLGLKSNEN